MNPAEQPAILKIGTTIDTYTAVDDKQVQEPYPNPLTPCLAFVRTHSTGAWYASSCNPAFGEVRESCHGGSDAGQIGKLGMVAFLAPKMDI